MTLSRNDRIKFKWGIETAWGHPLVDRDDLQRGSRIRVVLDDHEEDEWVTIDTRAILEVLDKPLHM